MVDTIMIIFILLHPASSLMCTLANDKIIIRLSRNINARDLFILRAIAIIFVSIISIFIIFRLSPDTNSWEGAVNTIESRELHTSAVTRWPHHHLGPLAHHQHHHDRHLCLCHPNTLERQYVLFVIRINSQGLLLIGGLGSISTTELVTGWMCWIRSI